MCVIDRTIADYFRRPSVDHPQPRGIVARKKGDSQEEGGRSGRDRIDIRADPAWVARAQRQADRFGISLSAYLKQAATKSMEHDEATDPALKDR